MKIIKKLLAGFMAVALIFSGLAFSLYAYATTYQEMALNTMYMGSFSGKGDMVWFTYTPQESGTYSLVSYTTASTVAYLYTKSVNENGSINFNGIAYAPASDPDYLNPKYRTFDDPATGKTYTHSSTSFRLEYHLDAGTTYYYSAKYLYDTAASGVINVVLMQDSVDSDVKTLTQISAVCNSSLTRFNDGQWETDSNGERYFSYNASKIIQNISITLHYSDGTSTTATGQDEIDGYRIRYSYNQSVNHWYIQDDYRHTQNTMTISASDVSLDIDVPICIGENANVKGKVRDYVTGESVSGAKLIWNNVTLATTDSNGAFDFNYPYGIYYVTVQYDNAFTREVLVTIHQNGSQNDFTTTPVSLIVGDYVEDGIINGKDAAYISRTFTGTRKVDEMQKWRSQFDLTADSYPALSLG